MPLRRRCREWRAVPVLDCRACPARSSSVPRCRARRSRGGFCRRCGCDPGADRRHAAGRGLLERWRRRQWKRRKRERRQRWHQRGGRGHRRRERGHGGANAGSGGASAGASGGGAGGSTRWNRRRCGRSTAGTGGATGGGTGGASAGTGGAAGRGGAGGASVAPAARPGGAAAAARPAAAARRAPPARRPSTSAVRPPRSRSWRWISRPARSRRAAPRPAARARPTSRGTARSGSSTRATAGRGASPLSASGPTARSTSLGDVSTAGMIGSTSYMAAVTHISVHPTGSWVFTAHFNSGHVAVSPVGATGAMMGAAGAPVDIERPAAEAHQIVSDASGRHVFVPCRSGNVIAQYAFDSVSGQLAAANPAAGAGRHGRGPAPHRASSQPAVRLRHQRAQRHDHVVPLRRERRPAVYRPRRSAPFPPA